MHDLLGSVRLRRYRTPIKLIYCCGLRLGECLSLTIHDILGEERKLVIRNSKGHQDHVIPLPALMLEDLRKYWSFHRHPRWLFPQAAFRQDMRRQFEPRGWHADPQVWIKDCGVHIQPAHGPMQKAGRITAGNRIARMKPDAECTLIDLRAAKP